MSETTTGATGTTTTQAPDKIKVVKTPTKTVRADTQTRYLGVMRKAKGNNVYTSPLYRDKQGAEDWVKVQKKQGNTKAAKVVTIKL